MSSESFFAFSRPSQFLYNFQLKVYELEYFQDIAYCFLAKYWHKQLLVWSWL